MYSHIIDEDRRRNAELLENAFYKKEHDNSPSDEKNLSVPAGVDAELLMKVLSNPEMAALLTSMAKAMNIQ